MKPLDPRLLRYSAAARGYLAVTVGLGLAGAALILLRASLLAHVLAAAATGTGTLLASPGVLAGSLAALGIVLAARAAAGYGGEVTALRAAAAVKSQLRRRLTDHVLKLGPSWLSGHRSGEVTTLATRGLDALDPYFARYLPQLVLACVVPIVVLIRVGLADWISGVVIGVTLRLAKPAASDAELAAAADRARLLDWIGSLPQGWDTPVGTHGTALSGGQRQRLALARALEGLDQVDEIVVLEHGQVTERGTHHQLIQAGGTYHRLRQARWAC